jgi:hypothetical protein
MNKEIHYTNPKETEFVLNIDVEDNGNGEEVLVVEVKDGEISFLVIDDEDNALYAMTYDYETFMDFIEARDFQVAMLAHSKELHEAMGRHPARMQPLLQLIDGGGNK